MSCYVDKLQVWPNPRNARVRRVGEKHGHQWCHLWADSIEELHELARKVGMKPEWFQNDGRLPHYDLVPPRREQAVALGAIEFDLADWFRGKRPQQAGQMELRPVFYMQNLPAKEVAAMIEQKKGERRTA